MSGAGEGVAVAAAAAPRRSVRPGVLVLLALSVAVQLVVLYAPEGAGPGLFPQADKVVHLLVFLVPAALAVVAGFRRRVVVAVFAAQAVLSEVVQAASPAAPVRRRAGCRRGPHRGGARGAGRLAGAASTRGAYRGPVGELTAGSRHPVVVWGMPCRW